MLTRLLLALGWPCRAYEISSRELAAHWWAKYTLPRILTDPRLRDQEGGQ